MTEKISNDDWEIVLHRVQAMPAHIKLAIGGHDSLSREDLISHIKAKDDVGKRVVEMQMNYLRFFSREMEKIAHG